MTRRLTDLQSGVVMLNDKFVELAVHDTYRAAKLWIKNPIKLELLIWSVCLMQLQPLMFSL